ncbi:MAG TPA: glutamate synthase central domain-containing protein, partial [Capsulimonadaceae bacterium]|nr:glutamate synthase central domain-containing protein [Capsulimonadaceae bacterium]
MLNYRPNDEHDACALVAYVRKDGTPSHGTVKRAINALEKMGHRSGGVDGEGDGCGVQTDIPRILWARGLKDEAGLDPKLADDPRFFVGHFFIPKRLASQSEEVKERVRQILTGGGCEIYNEDTGDVRHDALGKIARSNEPEFWQVAGMVAPFDHKKDPLGGDRMLFRAQLTIETQTPVHVVSLSTFTVVYKVHGNADILDHYYPQLSSPDYVSAISLGHSRYSTNTLSNFERVQPFALLGHNGEINTIDKLRREAQMLGIPITHDGSDSQDLDRALHGLIINHGLSLVEAMEIIFPPMADEVDKLPKDLGALYRFYRWVLGPLAQGPAAIIARAGDECVFGVDALGLRPLWFVESGTEYVFSSEQGVLPFQVILNNPKPLAPGEKIAIQLHRGKGTDLLPYHKLQRAAYERSSRLYDISKIDAILAVGEPKKRSESEDVGAFLKTLPSSPALPHESNRVAAYHWATQDVDYIEALCKTGNEPIASLGYDGPLAALAPDKQSLADYFKEAVAVVTNPAMDREREVEHFSTRVILGSRPNLSDRNRLPTGAVELKVPVLPMLSETRGALPDAVVEEVVKKLGTATLESLVAYFGPGAVFVLPLTHPLGQSTENAVKSVSNMAVNAAKSGATILLLDDTGAFGDGFLTLDPHLALIAVDRALREDFQGKDESGERGNCLRRDVSLILRSGGLRNLHDIIFALGTGADAVAPSLILSQAYAHAPEDSTEEEKATRLYNVISAIQKGLEKVISTMGTHELRGYGRIFASIGLANDLASLLEIRNFCGSKRAGLSFGRLDEQAAQRYELARSEAPNKKREDMRFYPKVW